MIAKYFLSKLEMLPNLINSSLFVYWYKMHHNVHEWTLNAQNSSSIYCIPELMYYDFQMIRKHQIHIYQIYWRWYFAQTNDFIWFSDQINLLPKIPESVYMSSLQLEKGEFYHNANNRNLISNQISNKDDILELVIYAANQPSALEYFWIN